MRRIQYQEFKDRDPIEAILAAAGAACSADRVTRYVKSAKTGMFEAKGFVDLKTDVEKDSIAPPTTAIDPNSNHPIARTLASDVKGHVVVVKEIDKKPQYGFPKRQDLPHGRQTKHVAAIAIDKNTVILLEKENDVKRTTEPVWTREDGTFIMAFKDRRLTEAQENCLEELGVPFDGRYLTREQLNVLAENGISFYISPERIRDEELEILERRGGEPFAFGRELGIKFLTEEHYGWLQEEGQNVVKQRLPLKEDRPFKPLEVRLATHIVRSYTKHLSREETNPGKKVRRERAIEQELEKISSPQGQLDYIKRMYAIAREIIRERSPTTADHLENLRQLAKTWVLAMQMENEAVELGETSPEVKYALSLFSYIACTHDIGKATTPIYILEGGMLIPEQLQVMYDHALVGALITGTPGLEAFCLTSMMHHKPFRKLEGSGGTGYPFDDLDLDKVFIETLGITVTDVFDALSAAGRSYKKAVPLDQTLQIMHGMVERGQLSPEALYVFVKHGLHRDHMGRHNHSADTFNGNRANKYEPRREKITEGPRLKEVEAKILKELEKKTAKPQGAELSARPALVINFQLGGTKQKSVRIKPIDPDNLNASGIRRIPPKEDDRGAGRG